MAKLRGLGLAWRLRWAFHWMERSFSGTAITCLVINERSHLKTIMVVLGLYFVFIPSSSLVPRKKVVGCRGGNRHVEWEPLIIGYLMLDDYLSSFTIGYLMIDDPLGVPYYRLFNV